MFRELVQFDGSNFYNKAKNICPEAHLSFYNYLKLAEFIVGKEPEKVIYYIGEIKKYPGNVKSEALYSSQQALFFNLRKQGIQVKLGYLLMSNGVYHEKGVNVQIAADMIYGTLRSEYDAFYLISSDTDLLPAVAIAKDEDKKVIYVGFENNMSKALLRNSSSNCILRKSDLLRFI